jgi:antitoxin MazE
MMIVEEGRDVKIAKLAKWGNSQGIRINKDVLKNLNFDLQEIETLKIKFNMQIINGKIILDPIKETTKLDKLFANFDGKADDYKVSIDWGEPTGKEVW